MAPEDEHHVPSATQSSPRITVIALLPLAFISLLVWRCDSLPFLDLPNHLTRAYLISHIHQPEFAQAFYYEPHFAPYILGDWMVAQLLRLLSPSTTARLLMIALFLAFVAATWLLARARHSRATGPTLLLLLSYLGTSYFYVSGFTSFLLSIVLVLLGVASWERWLVRRRAPEFICFVAIASLAYLSHLAGLFFFGTWIAAASVFRLYFGRIRARAVLLSALPFIALIAWHTLDRQLGANASDSFLFRSLTEKLFALGGMFIRYSYPLELPLALLFIALLIGLRSGRLRPKFPARLESHHEWLFLGIVFTGTFLALPHQVGPATAVDLRALPYMAICLLMFALESTPRERLHGRCALSIASLLALCNCSLLVHYWEAMDYRLARLMNALHAVPAGSQLLPIVTWEPVGRMAYGLHHGELHMVYSKGSIAPEVFANSNAPNQFPYFTYLSPGYSPGPFWYVRQQDAFVQWDRIASTYTHILITKPYDPTRIKLNQLRTVFENDYAAVLAVDS